MSYINRNGSISASRARRLILAVLPVGICHFLRPALAASWTGGSGSWSAANNWSPAGAPLPGDSANITHNDGANRLIVFDGNYNAPLSSFTVDQTGTGTTTFSM